MSKPADSEVGVYYIGSAADVKALETSQIIEVFNAVAKHDPELKLREVARFSTRAVAENRTWGLFVGFQKSDGETKKVEKKAADKKPKKGVPHPSPRAILDKEVAKAAKVYPVRPGSVQERALKLISRENNDGKIVGIAVDDFVAKMNEDSKKGKWSRGNAWSSLVYILHTGKGYGIRCRDGRFQVIK